MIENKNDGNNGLITDIIISCKDTLVVIEVKRNAVDARLQLKQQVNTIAGFMDICWKISAFGKSTTMEICSL